MTIWIRCSAGASIGYGHLGRCLTLADALTKCGQACGFIIAADQTSPIELIDARDHRVHTIPANGELADELDHYPAKTQCVLFDLCNSEVMRNRESLAALVAACKKRSIKTGMIDGLGDEAYTVENSFGSADWVLSPYALPADELPRTAQRWFHGAKFALLAPEFGQCSSHRPAQAATEIIVSTGGADPWDLSAIALAALAGIDGIALVRVILGPFFSAELKTTLKRLAKAVPADIDFLSFKDNPHTLYQSSTLGILGPGNTKYEAAACGLPSIILCPDGKITWNCRPFEYGGGAAVMNIAEVSEDELRNELSAMLSDRQRQIEMSRRCREFVDGRGIDRVVTLINDEFSSPMVPA